jgi:hypothetical protein
MRADTMSSLGRGALAAGGLAVALHQRPTLLKPSLHVPVDPPTLAARWILIRRVQPLTPMPAASPRGRAAA